MFAKTKNSRQQGTMGLGAAVAYFTELNYVVSLPLNDSQQYDLIVDDKTRLFRVQVKTTKQLSKYNIYSVQLKTKGGNQSWSGTSKFFDPSEVELLFVLCNNGDRYCIPTTVITCKSAINLGSKYKEYKV